MSGDIARKLRWSILAVVVLGVILGARLLVDRGLKVESDPTGASVFLNGHLVGRTPLTVYGIERGAYSLRLEKESFAPVTVPVEISWGQTRLDLKLPAREDGKLKVSVGPIGAEVLLDGELIGHTPLEAGGIPPGMHELLIRKTNFKPYSQRLDVAAGQVLEYRDFALEDIVMTMLQNAIDKEPQRVGHFADMGHYLFANNRIREAAEFYVRGLKVAAQPLTFPKEIGGEERELDQRLRNDDVQRINDDLRKKMHNLGRNLPAKDMALFQKLIEDQQRDNAEQNTGDWNWVQNQTENFIRDNKPDLADKLFLNHIEAAKGLPTAAQAHIGLIMLRVRGERGADALKAINDFAATRFPSTPALARQAANAIYTNVGAFAPSEKKALLAGAEQLMRQALGNSPHGGEMGALCKFELSNILVLEDRTEEAVTFYRESIAETNEPVTKALRSQRLVEALRKLKHVDQAREILVLLAKYPQTDISERARAELKELDALPKK